MNLPLGGEKLIDYRDGKKTVRIHGTQAEHDELAKLTIPKVPQVDSPKIQEAKPDREQLNMIGIVFGVVFAILSVVLFLKFRAQQSA